MGACLCGPRHGEAPAGVPVPSNGWTPITWQAAHQDFQWRPAGPVSPASFEDLLRHVDAHLDLVPQSCRRALLSSWRLRCTDRACEYARQVRVLEEERGRLCDALVALQTLRASRRFSHGMVRHFDAVCSVVEQGVFGAENELLKLGFAFAVQAQAHACG